MGKDTSQNSAGAPGINRAGRRVAVIGAGAFGGWTALNLLRAGSRVTLLDAWGPGNSRASSGGETRIIRATYGDRIYVQMAARALVLWKEACSRWKVKLFHPANVLWMVHDDEKLEKAAAGFMRDAGLNFDELPAPDASRRFPQINFAGVRWAIHERDFGYLTARRACEAVLEAFQAEGGEYLERAAEPGAIERGEMRGVKLSDGREIRADQFVFACGPWLGRLFPDLLGGRIHPTRQEVFFFGTPVGDPRYTDEQMPVWIDHGERFWYGIPGNQWRGFKVADDTRGPEFDPTAGERAASPEGLEAARRYMEMRFPGLKGAPLAESRVCQYENSPDQHFIIDRHPRAANVWLVGGGSGHGFKHGPAVGEMVAEMVRGKREPETMFRLERFGK